MGLSKGVIKIRSKLKQKQLAEVGYYFCEYCKSQVQDKLSGLDNSLTIDHVIPKSKGGTNDESNLKISCHKCNNLKSDKILNCIKLGEE